MFLFAHEGGSDGEEWTRMSELHMSDNDSDYLIVTIIVVIRHGLHGTCASMLM